MKLILRSLAIITLVAVLGTSSFATQCFIQPPPCYNHVRFDAIFTGKVTRYDDMFVVYPAFIEFEIDEVFKGSLDWKRLLTGIPMSSAGFDRFKIGDRFLVYGNVGMNEKLNQEILSTGLCTRTREIKSADEDLAFLRTLNDSTSDYRIWATVTMYGRSYSPVEGIRAEVRDGRKKLTAVSDENGDLQFKVSGPGKYKVRLLLPKGIYPGVSEWIYGDLPVKIPFTANRSGRYKKGSFAEWTVDVRDRTCGWIDASLSK